MNYRDCLSYLDRLGNEVMTMRFGLKTIRALLAQLGNPHLSYPSVLIAGTNGKGSVARFLNSIYTAAGVPNGLYTSPHLVGLRERFVVNDQVIDRDEFAACFSRVVEAIERLDLPFHPTYFETLTAVGFLHFQQQQVKLAILEVGMGGRLDSTNVADAVLSIVTPVGLDHQQFLGSSLEEVAAEKAGILKQDRPVLTAPQRDQVRQVLCQEAEKRGAQLISLDSSTLEFGTSDAGRYSFVFRGVPYQLPLYGRHQVENAALALQAVEVLASSGHGVPTAALKQGVEGITWEGRIQVLEESPTVVLDGAHNPDAAAKLADFLITHTRPPRTLMLGMMTDKDIAGVWSSLNEASFERVYLTRVDSPRAASPEDLVLIIRQGTPVAEPWGAYLQALNSSASTLVVAGSLYLVGEILAKVREQLTADH